MQIDKIWSKTHLKQLWVSQCSMKCSVSPYMLVLGKYCACAWLTSGSASAFTQLSGKLSYSGRETEKIISSIFLLKSSVTVSWWQETSMSYWCCEYLAVDRHERLACTPPLLHLHLLLSWTSGGDTSRYSACTDTTVWSFTVRLSNICTCSFFSELLLRTMSFRADLYWLSSSVLWSALSAM